ncbi:MAG: efflux RND transporter periplasmic adaptor subunit [Thiohalomonadales bacterium]
MKYKKVFIFAGIISVVFVLTLLSNILGGRNAKMVDAELLAARVIESSILASGKLVHAQEVLLSTEEAGRVEKIYVKEGDEVKQHQLLLKINDEANAAVVVQQKALVRLSESNIEAQLLRVDILKEQKQRKETLFKQNLINEDIFDILVNKLEVAKVELKSLDASLSQAKGQLQQAENSLNKTRIYSPIDGIVTSLDIKVGETVIPSATSMRGSSLMIIADPGSISTEINVDEADIANIAINQQAEIVAIAYPEQPLKGIVETIASTAKVEKGRQGLSFKVKIRLIDNDKIKLRPGMSCRAEIFTNSSSKVPAVPIQAIMVENNLENKKTRYFVFVNQKNVAQKIEVTTGISDDEYQEIKSGVNLNDTIIIGPDNILRHLLSGDALDINEIKPTLELHQG